MPPKSDGILGSGRRPLPSANIEHLKHNSASDSSSCLSSDVDLEPEEIEGEGDARQEDWIDWIRRTTHLAEEHFQRAGLEDWVAAVRRKHWRWAGHLARRTDGRWSSKLLSWTPGGRRSRGHPCKRWSDDLDEFFHRMDGSPRGYWQLVAQNREPWHCLEDRFVKR